MPARQTSSRDKALTEEDYCLKEMVHASWMSGMVSMDRQDDHQLRQVACCPGADLDGGLSGRAVFFRPSSKGRKKKSVTGVQLGYLGPETGGQVPKVLAKINIRSSWQRMFAMVMPGVKKPSTG